MDDETIKLLHSNRRIIGLKQTVIAVESGQIETVLLAADAEEHIKQRVTVVCKRHNVTVISAPPRAAMGRECGIDVGAAVVGVRKAGNELKGES